MRAILQRVSSANVSVDSNNVGAISHGWIVLLGISKMDTHQDLDYIIDKTLNLRAFADDSGKMNRSVRDTNGSILIVSQFTLYGDCRKGRRPSFTDAATPEVAQAMYENAILKFKESGLDVASGQFQANMQVTLTNDGPVTFILDSQSR